MNSVILAALTAFYFATGGPDWLDNTNWLSDAPLETWHGVEATPDGLDVQTLGLFNNRLSGPIPPELGQLTALEYLHLGTTPSDAQNRLSGPIPPELGQLTALEVLGLAGNQLSGPIPPELGRLTRLEYLILDRNELTGPIPPELGHLTATRGLLLNNNQLTGPIPSELSRIGRDAQGGGGLRGRNVARVITRYFDLSENQLSGPIPPELGRMTGFQRMSLAGNRLSGPIPPELGRIGTDSLQLADNELSGPIPPELGRFTGSDLSLRNNQLSGPIPPELGQLTALQYLSLDGNQLSGPIPSELGQLTALRYLSIDGDTGLCLPPEIRDTVFGQLATQEATIGGTGRVINNVPLCIQSPTEAAIVAALRAFYFATGGPHWQNDDNWLSDAPFSTWYGIEATANGSGVRSLALRGNGLQGSLPSELGQLTTLEDLNLNDNDLSGPIPSELGQLTALEILGLAGNHLSGPIPPELSQLTGLASLWLRNNELSGPIPSELGQLTALEVMYLGDNELSGPIPSELGQLTGLRYLSIDGDTGLCIPPQIQATVFGRLAIDQNGVPLCGAVPTLPVLAAWGLALALLLLGLHLMSGNPVRPAVVVTE